jgi:hypothetical protein
MGSVGEGDCEDCSIRSVLRIASEKLAGGKVYAKVQVTDVPELNEVVDDTLSEMGCALLDGFEVVTNPDHSRYVGDFKIAATESCDRNTTTVQDLFGRGPSESDDEPGL